MVFRLSIILRSTWLSKQTMRRPKINTMLTKIIIFTNILGGTQWLFKIPLHTLWNAKQ